MKSALVSLLFSLTAFANPCLEVRGLFDVGSGSSKIRVATVDSCLQKIEKIHFEGSEKVSYANDLSAQEKNGFGLVFSEAIQVKGLKALQDLKAKIPSALEVQSWRGYATSAFRSAMNGAEVLQRYAEALDVPLKVIDQDTEGKLGFIAGILVSKEPTAAKTVVWDIGGGSQQWSSLGKKGLDVTKVERKASDRMKEIVLEIQKSSSSTPNPVGLANIDEAIKRASDLVTGLNLPVAANEVIGVGSIFSVGVAELVGKKESFEQEDLEIAIRNYSLLSDSEINATLKKPSAYVDTAVTNMILILGIMRAFGIPQVLMSPSGTTEGGLVYPPIWD